MLDLSAFYNLFLDENWNPSTSRNNSLAALPFGTPKLGGMKFDARGIIQLGGGVFRDIPAGHFPERVSAISVGRACHRLHFLHATVIGTSDGSQIGSFVLHFNDGKTETVPIIYGRDVRDWADTPDPLPVAWSNQEGELTLRLYKTTWENPTPDRVVQSVDYVSSMSQCGPFLVAMTLEK